jgi:hypothetical protein
MRLEIINISPTVVAYFSAGAGKMSPIEYC